MEFGFNGDHCIAPPTGNVWPGGVMVRALACDPRVQFLAVPLSGNDLVQVVHTHVLLSPSSIIWYRSRGIDVLRLGR